MSYKFETNYGRIGTARADNLQAYYKFDGDITDSSGNGLDLTTQEGSLYYTYISNLKCVRFNGGLVLDRNSNDSALTITGALTVHMFLVPDVITSGAGGSSDWIMNFGSGGGDEADNILYSLAIDTRKWSYFAEAGQETNNNIYWRIDNVVPALSTPVFLTLTRSSSGSAAIYINGQDAGDYTDVNSSPADGSPNVSPTGGTNCRLIVGGDPTASARHYLGAMAELQILDVELTAAQVLEDARKVMPWL